jgi:hypothetical protein
MKEDVLEQLVDDYLMHQGYFTRHNIRFKPFSTHADFKQRADSVASDIDVIGVHPCPKKDQERVVVVSCKSWQYGFDPAAKVTEITSGAIRSGREAWKGFRELWEPKWSEGFLHAVEEATGTRQFEYLTVVTRLRNESGRSQWEQNPKFRENIGGNKIRILTLTEMLDFLWQELTKTAAASEIGRSIQLMKAAGWQPPPSPKPVVAIVA